MQFDEYGRFQTRDHALAGTWRKLRKMNDYQLSLTVFILNTFFPLRSRTEAGEAQKHPRGCFPTMIQRELAPRSHFCHRACVHLLKMELSRDSGEIKSQHEFSCSPCMCRPEQATGPLSMCWSTHFGRAASLHKVLVLSCLGLPHSGCSTSSLCCEPGAGAFD